MQYERKWIYCMLVSVEKKKIIQVSVAVDECLCCHIAARTSWYVKLYYWQDFLRDIM